MCFTVQLSMSVAVSDSFDILSCCFDFVKNFFNFFQKVFSFFFDLVASNFDIISFFSVFVNNFFDLFLNLFCCSLERNLFIIPLCFLFVNIFFQKNIKTVKSFIRKLQTVFSSSVTKTLLTQKLRFRYTR